MHGKTSRLPHDIPVMIFFALLPVLQICCSENATTHRDLSPYQGEQLKRDRAGVNASEQHARNLRLIPYYFSLLFALRERRACSSANVTALEKDPSKARSVSKQASSPGVLRSLTNDRTGRLRGRLLQRDRKSVV